MQLPVKCPTYSTQCCKACSLRAPWWSEGFQEPPGSPIPQLEELRCVPNSLSEVALGGQSKMVWESVPVHGLLSMACPQKV